MMLAASSASGSGQYLLANTRQASASCTWVRLVWNYSFKNWIQSLTQGFPYGFTLALSRSCAFMRLPWKYFTLVCCFLRRPSNSKSGSARWRKTTSTSTSSLSSWRKSFRKTDTDSKVIFPQTTMCLGEISVNLTWYGCPPFALDRSVGAHPLAPLAQQLQDLWQHSGKQHLKRMRVNTLTNSTYVEA